MPSAEDLYQEIILDHNKRPRNYGILAGATHSANGDNPLCGDELTVQLRVDHDRLESVRFTGQGCAISRASASMMTVAVEGKPLKLVEETIQRVIEALKSGTGDPVLQEEGELASLLGVCKFPARIKCATLAWHALDAALKGRQSASTETDG